MQPFHITLPSPANLAPQVHAGRRQLSLNASRSQLPPAAAAAGGSSTLDRRGISGAARRHRHSRLRAPRVTTSAAMLLVELSGLACIATGLPSGVHWGSRAPEQPALGGAALASGGFMASVSPEELTVPLQIDISSLQRFGRKCDGPGEVFAEPTPLVAFGEVFAEPTPASADDMPSASALVFPEQPTGMFFQLGMAAAPEAVDGDLSFPPTADPPYSSGALGPFPPSTDPPYSSGAPSLQPPTSRPKSTAPMTRAPQAIAPTTSTPLELAAEATAPITSAPPELAAKALLEQVAAAESAAEEASQKAIAEESAAALALQQALKHWKGDVAPPAGSSEAKLPRSATTSIPSAVGDLALTPVPAPIRATGSTAPTPAPTPEPTLAPTPASLRRSTSSASHSSSSTGTRNTWSSNETGSEIGAPGRPPGGMEGMLLPQLPPIAKARKNHLGSRSFGQAASSIPAGALPGTNGGVASSGSIFRKSDAEEPHGLSITAVALGLAALLVLGLACLAAGFLAAGLLQPLRLGGGRGPRVQVERMQRCEAVEIERRLPSSGGYDCMFSKPASSGQLLRLEVRVEPPPVPLTSPLTGSACVLYSAAVSRQVHGGVHPAPVAYNSCSIAFEVSLVGAPEVRIALQGADVALFDMCAGRHVVRQPLAEAPDLWQDFVIMHRAAAPMAGLQASAMHADSSILEFQECALHVGAVATVVGELHRSAAGALSLRPLQLDSAGRAPGSSKRAAWRTSWEQIGCPAPAKGAPASSPQGVFDNAPAPGAQAEVSVDTAFAGKVLASDDPSLITAPGRDRGTCCSMVCRIDWS